VDEHSRCGQRGHTLAAHARAHPRYSPAQSRQRSPHFNFSTLSNTLQHSPTLFNTLQHSSTLSNTFQMIPQPIHLQSWIHLPSIHYPSFIIFQNEEFSSFCTSLHHQVCHSAASHTAASHTADISLIYLDPGRPNRPPFEGVAGFRIRKEHMSDSSTAMTAPALSNSPQ